MPVTVTALPVPTFLSAMVPLRLWLARLTLSPDTAPLSTPLVVLTVTLVLALYWRSVAFRLLATRPRCAMFTLTPSMPAIR